MKDHFISPLYDFAFAEIFGNQRNIDTTANFLKTLLDIPEDEYGRLTVVDPTLKKFFRRDKKGIVDLKLTTKSGKIIHIELQVEKQASMKNRIVYYLSRLISDQIRSGEKYREIHQVISIVICDHNLLEDENYYINEFELRNKKNHSFTNLMKLVILELPKLTETEDSPVWRWLRFLKCEKKEEFKMMAKEYPELKKPIVTIEKMSIFEKLRYIRFHRNLQKEDARMREEYVREEGVKEAREEVLSLIDQGLSTEEIRQRLS